MKRDIIVLGIAAIFAFVFAVYNIICVIVLKKRVAYAVGTVVSVTTPVPETSKARNSKWAYISYNIDGKHYTSQKRIQVPMSAEIGSSVKICYDKNSPEKLFTFSAKRVVVSSIVGIFCIIVIFIKIKG